MKMSKLSISKDFTIDDIHKIREYNSERRKNFTTDELISDIEKSANKAEKRINEFRKKKVAI